MNFKQNAYLFSGEKNRITSAQEVFHVKNDIFDKINNKFSSNNNIWTLKVVAVSLQKAIEKVQQIVNQYYGFNNHSAELFKQTQTESYC